MADQQQKKRGIADIVFLIDATGSMAPCINDLKKNIETFIDTLSTGDANNSSPVKDWRAKVVGYRDFTSATAPAFVDNSFVRDAVALKAQLGNLQATEGEDEPESLLDALYKVASQAATARGELEDAEKWRYRSEAARVVVVFTDAPYHDTMSIPEVAGGTLADVKNACHNNKIVLTIFAPMLPCYNELSAIQGSEYFAVGNAGDNPQEALKRFTADQANFKRTLEQLAKTISNTAVLVV
jgi:hypothetical protein